MAVGDVVIWDELRSRWEPEVRQALVKAGLGRGRHRGTARTLILIEAGVVESQESLQPVTAWATGTWSDADGSALEQVRPQDILGWSRSCGVCATPGLKPPALLSKESSWRRQVCSFHRMMHRKLAPFAPRSVRARFQQRVAISWRVRHP